MWGFAECLSGGWALRDSSVGNGSSLAKTLLRQGAQDWQLAGARHTQPAPTGTMAWLWHCEPQGPSLLQGFITPHASVPAAGASLQPSRDGS